LTKLEKQTYKSSAAQASGSDLSVDLTFWVHLFTMAHWDWLCGM